MAIARDDHGGKLEPPDVDRYPGMHQVSMGMGSTADLAKALREDAENLAYKVGQAQQRMTNTTQDFHGKGLGLDERNPRAAEIAGFHDSLSTNSVMFTDNVSQRAEREGMLVELARQGLELRDILGSEAITATTNQLELISNNDSEDFSGDGDERA